MRWKEIRPLLLEWLRCNRSTIRAAHILSISQSGQAMKIYSDLLSFLNILLKKLPFYMRNNPRALAHIPSYVNYPPQWTQKALDRLILAPEDDTSTAHLLCRLYRVQAVLSGLVVRFSRPPEPNSAQNSRQRSLQDLLPSSAYSFFYHDCRLDLTQLLDAVAQRRQSRAMRRVRSIGEHLISIENGLSDADAKFLADFRPVFQIAKDMLTAAIILQMKWLPRYVCKDRLTFGIFLLIHACIQELLLRVADGSFNIAPINSATAPAQPQQAIVTPAFPPPSSHIF